MIKMTMIGHLGKDAVVNYQGTESVINFSLAHTDKWKDNGVQKERTTWVSCSWWVESSKVAEYMKKGQQVYVEGFPEAKIWNKKQGAPEAFLNLRVYNLQLLGGSKKEENSQPSQAAPAPQPTNNNSEGYEPISDDDLPF